MELQSVCRAIFVPRLGFPGHGLSLASQQIVSPSEFGLRNQELRHGILSKSHRSSGLNSFVKEPLLPRLNRGAVARASNSTPKTNLESRGEENSGLGIRRIDGVEPFRGKSGSVSFVGLTHQLVEEAKLVSAPFDEEKGSFLWVLAPAAFIASLVLPQFFLSNLIEAFLVDVTVVEIVTSLSFEVLFYIGLATFLSITDYVQRPYLQFSTKRWNLITGLRGYLTSAFFTMGFKVVAPLFAVYVTWPVVGLPVLVAVVPFLVGCFAQFAFETLLDKRGSSCWPLVPIIFEADVLDEGTSSFPDSGRKK